MGDGLVANFEVRGIACDLRWAWRGPEVLVLFGPSGAGKTTILRALAGLERPASGSISVDGQVWFDAAGGVNVPPQRRRVGFIHQEPALFPHLTVQRNVEFGVDGGSTDHEHAAALIRNLGLSALAGRKPAQISGGERQRVALARALAPRPRLLLLDEPLSSLDEASRAELRSELRSIIVSSGVPAIVVTHDRTEALTLGDVAAVIDRGRIVQLGPVSEVFSRPADPAVARIVGIETVVSGKVGPPADGVSEVTVGGCLLSAVNPDGIAGDALVCIRAVDVILRRAADAAPGDSARNHLPGRVTAVRDQDPLMRVDLDCGFALAALITRQSCREMGLAPGVGVVAVLKAPSVHLVGRPSRSAHPA